jgi:anthranilate synthase component 1
MINFEQFEKRATEYNVVPLVKTLLADLHTPVSTYLALRQEGSPSFLLETVERDERTGRFSFVGIDPRVTIRETSDGIMVSERGRAAKSGGDIFDVLTLFSERYKQAPDPDCGDGLIGGFVGYVGYNAVRHLERIPLPDGDSDTYDESRFDLFASIVRFDHQMQSLTLIHNVFLEDPGNLREQYADGRKVLETLELRLRRSVVGTRHFKACLDETEDLMSRREFCSAVEKAKQYVFEGDVFQVVLSRRMRLRYHGDLFAVYRALRVINPSPYLFFIDFGHTKLVGSSPEVLVRVQGRKVELLPIAGTRPRGATEMEERKLEADLVADEKEGAEHLMLVDLGRNDLGRVSEYGSVEVPVFKRVDRYSHVMHLVSHLRGTLKNGLGPIDALRSSFPAGTVSGAPKVRAMEIISELEGRSRGLYAGAVGYLGLNGSLDTCIGIRTLFAHGDHITLQVGAGIVADSVPESEYTETVNKSAALLAALENASSMNRLSERHDTGD